MSLDKGREKTLAQLMLGLFQMSEFMSPLNHRNYLDQFATQEINESFLCLASVVIDNSTTFAFRM